RRRPLPVDGVHPVGDACRPCRRNESDRFSARVVDRRSLDDVRRSGADDAAGRDGHDLRPGRRRVRDHRPRELSRAIRRMGHGDHRTHFRHLRSRVPARHCWRARRMVGTTRALIAALVAALATFSAIAQDLQVHAACRDGAPHGAYELRASDGQLRVAGAFNRGKRTGSFIFWTRTGVRIAHIPYDEDRVSGTLSLWFLELGSGGDPAPKLQAGFAAGHRNGVTRSWYPNGQPRAIYRYETDQLGDARAWSTAGVLLP